MSEELNKQQKKIVDLLKAKSAMKQDVFRNTISTFGMIREVCKEVFHDVQNEIQKIDKRVTLNFTDVNQQALQLKVAGDLLEFYMHTNVFDFEKSHPMFKTGYIKNGEYNSYCGIINVYNFLADSFLHNRYNDLGFLVARIFVNREMKFFIEAKAPFGLKYNTFSSEPITKDVIKEVVQDLMVYVISYDLYTPPFEAVREVTVNEMQEKTSSISLRTGKRLGFASDSNYDDDLII